MKEEKQCFCCDNLLKTESLDCDPLILTPTYDGLIFRTSGNFGSTVFDPMPFDKEEYLQVIICDDCIKKNVKRVMRIHNVQRKVTSDIERFKIDV